MDKKKIIGICLGSLVVLIGIFSVVKTIYSKSELIGKVSLFNNFEKEFNLEDIIEEETLSLKDIEEEREHAVIEKNNNIESVVVNNPVVEIKENKNEITKEEVLKRTETKPKIEVDSVNKEEKQENELVQNVIETKNEMVNVKTETFVKLVKNESVVANMQAMMFALLPTDWFFSNSKVVIDSDGIDENTEYVTFDKLNQELLKNRKSGDIKIFAYDEIWNNGTSDYVRKTRCYIR